MIREQFLQDPAGAKAYPRFPELLKVLSCVQEYEKKTGKTLEDGFTKKEYVAIFNTMSIRYAAMFTRYKYTLLYYVRYLIANDVLPQEHEDLLLGLSTEDISITDSKKVIYHKNIYTLRDAIEDSISASDNYDERRFDAAIAVIYLAWYGLSKDEIIHLPKTAITENGVLLNGKEIQMEDFVVRFLKEYRDSDGYTQQARGVILHKYISSENLIRTTRNAVIDNVGLRGMLYRLNALLDGIYSLEYGTIYQSGIFFRAYMQECSSSKFDLDDLEFASKVFCEPIKLKQVLTLKRKDYQLYKQLFY